LNLGAHTALKKGRRGNASFGRAQQSGAMALAHGGLFRLFQHSLRASRIDHAGIGTYAFDSRFSCD
jgi:hypothetical protein